MELLINLGQGFAYLFGWQPVIMILVVSVIVRCLAKVGGVVQPQATRLAVEQPID